MGANIRLRRLSDYVRRDANLQVACTCGHVSVLDADKLRRWFFCHGWNDALEVVGAHLRCSTCRGRQTRLSPTPDSPTGLGWGPRCGKRLEGSREAPSRLTLAGSSFHQLLRALAAADPVRSHPVQQCFSLPAQSHHALGYHQIDSGMNRWHRIAPFFFRRLVASACSKSPCDLARADCRFPRADGE